MKQIQRINYANQKHHRQQLREQIDPRLIQDIEIDRNPSLNYRNALKAVELDELEKTMKFQQQRKQKDKQNHQILLNPLQNDSVLYRNASLSTINCALLPFKQLNNNGPQPEYRNQSRSNFIDYDLQRKRKFQHLIQGGYDGGQSFFRAQDQYQKRRQEQSRQMRSVLLQQLQLKQNRRVQESEAHNQQIEVFKQNRRKQVEHEMGEAERQRREHVMVGEEVRHQAENERIKRHHKSFFQFDSIGRYNPITNPIQYHIDNPYILQKYSANYLQNDPQQYCQKGIKKI